MMTTTRGSGVESRLLDLLEYRVILGAVITTPDGLLVASSAVDLDDAELIAATTADSGSLNDKGAAGMIECSSVPFLNIHSRI